MSERDGQLPDFPDRDEIEARAAALEQESPTRCRSDGYDWDWAAEPPFNVPWKRAILKEEWDRELSRADKAAVQRGQ
jgi:hypothetical protein